MNFFQSPYHQLILFLAFCCINFAIKWRDTAYVLQSGLTAIILWMVAGGIIGIPGRVPWSYYLSLVIALIGGYAVYLTCSWISHRWGGEPFKPYNQESFILVLTPLFFSPVVFIPLLLIKLIILFFS